MGQAMPRETGLTACKKAWECYHREIDCRVLRVRMPEGDYHAFLVYQFPSGEVFAYDGNGSKALGKVGWSRGYVSEAYRPGCSDVEWITSF